MSPKKKPDKPLAAYTRVSSQGDRADEELLSHALQRERIEAGAVALGYELLRARFEDTDVSGGTMDRPQFNRVMEGIRRGEYGGIAVAKLSRFGRTVSGALSAIKEIEERGGAFVSLDPPIDTSTATGRFILTVFLGLYAMEREATAEIAHAVKEKKIAAGIHQATHAPAGYTYEVLGHTETGKEIRGKLVPNEHAPAVKEAFELRASGGTWAEVAGLLTERGVPSRSGRWSYTGARSIIENPVYRGIAISGSRNKENAHEKIVPRSLWDAANARTGTRSATWNGHDGPLLGGLIRCGSCGHAMSKDWTAHRKDGSDVRYMSYKCKSNPSCGPGSRASISARIVEPLVVDAALGMVGSAAYEAREPAEDVAGAAEWDAKLEALDAEQAELDAELESGAVSAAAYGKASTVLERRRMELEASRPQATLGDAYVMFVSETGVRDAFEAATLPRRRAVLRQLVRRVIVQTGRGPDRVSVELADFRPEDHGLLAVGS